jgi:hypothetical protein
MGVGATSIYAETFTRQQGILLWGEFGRVNWRARRAPNEICDCVIARVEREKVSRTSGLVRLTYKVYGDVGSSKEVL